MPVNNIYDSEGNLIGIEEIVEMTEEDYKKLYNLSSIFSLEQIQEEMKEKL